MIAVLYSIRPSLCSLYLQVIQKNVKYICMCVYLMYISICICVHIYRERGREREGKMQFYTDKHYPLVSSSICSSLSSSFVLYCLTLRSFLFFSMVFFSVPQVIIMGFPLFCSI